MSTASCALKWLILCHVNFTSVQDKTFEAGTCLTELPSIKLCKESSLKPVLKRSIQTNQTANQQDMAAHTTFYYGAKLDLLHSFIEGLNNTIEQPFANICRTFYPTTVEYTFSSSTHRSFSRIAHMLGQKTSLKNLRRLKSYHKEMKLEINRKRKTGKLTSMKIKQHTLEQPLVQRKKSKRKLKNILRQQK